VIFILITVFIDVVGIGLIVPVTPSLLAEVSGKTIGEAAAYGGWLVGPGNSLLPAGLAV
jgi:DHA1 family tetracycline resistance protein-like MFS transporter